MQKSILITLLALLLAHVAHSQLPQAPAKEWKQLFNGKDLSGWAVKIRGYDLNDNYGATFRIANGRLKVNYDQYDAFNERFGHIFYRQQYSHYVIATKYRFVEEQAKDGPDWAFRNSGIMVHCQEPGTMAKNQDFPISIEVQLLGGRDAGERSTCNLCTPGTHVVLNGKLEKTHCINSTSKTFRGDQWVRAEVRVLGDSLIEHYVNGERVMRYEKPQVGGEVVNDFDSRYKIDGTPLTAGYISLQSESHPIEFRKVELLNLEGCMDPQALNYKSYYVRSKPSDCRYAAKKSRKKT